MRTMTFAGALLGLFLAGCSCPMKHDSCPVSGVTDARGACTCAKEGPCTCKGGACTCKKPAPAPEKAP